ncbi:putative secreted protein with PEP-CTERM sorting signal [Nitrosospira sp. Nsp2]|uniref:Lcl domain-containing protein n=1 Tax=Nitrosospira sp. Nsp2 TaxID=136548 RepID=UPI000D4FBF55|nr:DUF1566 domain-containing protein [Nitrosospira sp. Nsp2]PTR16955.1 putative secreted protein with PEP-CTERM sorting signal [Nitrosospira sp. Nsp2]
MNKRLNSKNIVASLLLAAGFVCTPIAQAALEDLGNGVIKDTALDIVWLADANNSKTSGYNTDGLMTWSSANNWASQLNVGGYSDWHLPSTSELSHLFFDDLEGINGHTIYESHNNAKFALFSNIQADYNVAYWTTTPTGDADTHSAFRFYRGDEFADAKNVGHYAIAVNNIPEPDTYAMLLAGLGLVGFIARRRKLVS